MKLDAAMDAQLTAAEVAAKEHVLAIGLLIGSDRTCYRKLLEDLENNFTQGRDNCPATLQHHAYSLLVHWKQDLHNIVQLIGGTNDGMAFANVGSKDSGWSGGNSGGNRGQGEQRCCYNCGEVGHISRDGTTERAC